MILGIILLNIQVVDNISKPVGHNFYSFAFGVIFSLDLILLERIGLTNLPKFFIIADIFLI